MLGGGGFGAGRLALNALTERCTKRGYGVAKQTTLIAKRGLVKVHETSRGWRIDVRFYVYRGEVRKDLEYWLAKLRRDLAEVWPVGEEVDAPSPN